MRSPTAFPSWSRTSSHARAVLAPPTGGRQVTLRASADWPSGGALRWPPSDTACECQLAAALNPPHPVADEEDVGRGTSFGEIHRSTPLRPLIGFALLAAAAVAIGPHGTDWSYVALAGLLFAAGACAVALSPARDDSTWLPLVPALSALVAIAFLRQSQGGATSGYSPLAMLAVVWAAVTLDQRAVRLITACSAMMLAVPLLLIGAPL